MSTAKSKSEKEQDNENATDRPDSGTLGTTDPQEHMEGPVSSLVQKVEEGFEGENAKKNPDKESDE